eukprot:TRINITY_DN21853_c0_g1_i1.p1 TRINITY_DN21853_c0_g1~~TRINITY_DN21853_c0_g1_i1.p1  ORF type:complete len:1377 (+),score=308.43 TRINITY_DN21853_c0_g1_i1:150-4280(+)
MVAAGPPAPMFPLDSMHPGHERKCGSSSQSFVAASHRRRLSAPPVMAKACAVGEGDAHPEAVEGGDEVAASSQLFGTAGLAFYSYDSASRRLAEGLKVASCLPEEGQGPTLHLPVVERQSRGRPLAPGDRDDLGGGDNVSASSAGDVGRTSSGGGSVSRQSSGQAVFALPSALRQVRHWRCLRCTYVNTPQARCCGSCGGPRPQAERLRFGRRASEPLPRGDLRRRSVAEEGTGDDPELLSVDEELQLLKATAGAAATPSLPSRSKRESPGSETSTPSLKFALFPGLPHAGLGNSPGSGKAEDPLEKASGHYKKQVSACSLTPMPPGCERRSQRSRTMCKGVLSPKTLSPTYARIQPRKSLPVLFRDADHFAKQVPKKKESSGASLGVPTPTGRRPSRTSQQSSQEDSLHEDEDSTPASRGSSRRIMISLQRSREGSLVGMESYPSGSKSMTMDMLRRVRRHSLASEDGSVPEVAAGFARLIEHRVLANRCAMVVEERETFKAAIRANCLTAAMSDEEVSELMTKADVFRFKPGEKVVRQHEQGMYFFVIKDGRCRIGGSGSSNSSPNHRGGDERQEGGLLGPGDSFGETEVLHSHKYTASIEALGPNGCTLWGIDGNASGVFVRVMTKCVRRICVETWSLLDKVRTFQFIDPGTRKDLIQKLVVQIFPAGSHIVHEGGTEHTNRMYVVKSGAVAVMRDGKQVDVLRPGEQFGEAAFLYKRPRGRSILALEESQLIPVTQELLQEALGKSYDHVMWRNVVFLALRSFARERLEDVEDFKDIAEADLGRLADQFLIQDVAPDTKLEARGLRFIIVLEGSIVVRKPDGHDEDERVLGTGECFGERYIREASLPFQHTVDSCGGGESDGSRLRPTKLALLFTDSFNSWIRHNTKETLSQQQKLTLVRKVYVFRHLSNHHCNLIANSFRTIIRTQGEKVIQEGEVGSEFFVINSGELVVTREDRTLRTLGVADYFGERGLLYNEPRTATVTCKSKQSELLVINKAVFMAIIEDKMLEHLEERIRLQQTEVELEDFRTLKICGRGTFGVVKLVEHQRTKTRYALKCISRLEAVKNNQQENLLLEREILLENDHPFIVKVVRTFKDQTYVYFLTELVTGGELYDTIRAIGLLGKWQAQFYTGSLILALESLHNRNIAYRDLKPENVLLDSQGHTKLIDFGCAVKLGRATGSLPDRTDSLVGTPHYMAPEVILGNGYGLSCDVWSLGVCLYEFICGPMPYGHEVESPMEIFRQTLQAPLQLAPHIQDYSAAHILQKLLCRDVEKRLGCGKLGLRALVQHPYFSDFNIDLLLSRKLDPPWIPEVKEFEEADEDEGDGEAAAKNEEQDDASGSSSGGLSDSSEDERQAKSREAAAPSHQSWDKDF